jgi:hypothetical protein
MSSRFLQGFVCDFVCYYRSDPVQFRQDLFNIARTTLSSKVLSQDKNYFANLAVDAVLRMKVSLAGNRCGYI